MIDFLGFRSSTMAAAAVLCTAREIADFSTTVELYPAIFPEMASHEVLSESMGSYFLSFLFFQ